MSKFHFLNYFKMMRYEGSLPEGYKAFTLIVLCIGYALGSINIGSLINPEEVHPLRLLAWVLVPVLVYTFYYYALYKVLKNRFSNYFFRLFISVQVIRIILDLSFVLFVISKKTSSGIGMNGYELKLEGLTENLRIISTIIELVLMSIPLKWALNKPDSMIKETIS